MQAKSTLGKVGGFFTALLNDKRFLVALFIILLAYGGLIRLFNLGGESFWIDESISAIAAKAIHEQGAPRFESGFLYSRASVFHYMMSFFLLFGYDEFNARLISILFGLATCVLVFYIGRIYNKETAWIAFILSLFMEIFIVYSREARMYQLEMFLFFLCFYLLYKALMGKKTLILASLVFLLAYETHVIALLLLPFLLYVALKRVKEYEEKSQKSILIYFYLLAGIAILYFGIRYIHMLSEFRWRYISSYLSHLRYYAPFLLLSIIGLILSWKKKLSLLLAGALLFNLLAGGFHLTFGYRYIYLCFVPAVVLSAYVLSRIRFKWAVVLLYILWMSNLFTPVSYSFVLTPMQSISHYDPTAPRMNFAPFYEELGVIPANKTFVTTFTPAAQWYFGTPNYWTYFSFSGAGGREKNESLYLGKDVYTGAEVIYNLTDFMAIAGEKLVVADSWSLSRIDGELRDFFVTNCSEIFNKTDVFAYSCDGKNKSI